MGKVEGPDQPRSWLIAMAGCIVNTLLSGISRATGIFYVALIDVYGISRLEANMPFTMRNCVRNLAGPIVGVVGQRYGVQAVTLAGGILATLGIALCAIAPNVIWICIFWGGFHGLGVAFANTLFQVTVNQYFVKYRATAVGLALSGACLGSFIFPVTLEFFVNKYGLSGAFLLTGGLIMQVLPAGILLKEPSWLSDEPASVKPVDSRKEKETKLETIAETNGKSEEVNGKDATDTEKSPRRHNSSISAGKGNSDSEKQSSSISKPRKTSGIENPNFNGSVPDISGKTQDKNYDGTHSLRRSRTISASEVSITIPPEELEKYVEPNLSLWKSVLKLYSNPMFHMISFSLAAFGTLFDPLMTVIVDYINDKGLDERVGKYLISVLALGDLAGRMCFGWVTDKKYMSLAKFILLNQVIQGVCFILFPVFDSFEELMGVVIIYGVSAGTTIVMFPVLVAKYLANEQALAFGCIAFFAGVISFAVPPLIGHFRDNAGSYDGMFYITGGMSVVIGFMWLLEPCLVKLGNRKSYSVEETVDSR